MNQDEYFEKIESVEKESDADVYLYAGEIVYHETSDFVDCVCGHVSPRSNAVLFLTTPGGDPHAAFRMVRAIRHRYNIFKLIVTGPCKSAGTLIAIGADVIALSPTGELGPLDVQTIKPDEIVASSSGLDIFQALNVVSNQAYEMFEQNLIRVLSASRGSVSTKTAAEIAGTLAVGLFEPIMSQVDPMRLGEMDRAIRIAHKYTELIGTPNLKNGAIDALVSTYPSHGFVIDKDEAARLFTNVLEVSSAEQNVANLHRSVLRHYPQYPEFRDLSDLVRDARAVQATDVAEQINGVTSDPASDKRADEGGSKDSKAAESSSSKPAKGPNGTERSRTRASR